jgi:endonuclease/exonuclease/phosphatase family metal-dependent hydrolase
MDRRMMPGRVVAMLASLDADVIAVQELDVGQPARPRIDQPTFIAEASACSSVLQDADYCGGEYGHALFTRLTTRETTIVPCRASGRASRAR